MGVLKLKLLDKLLPDTLTHDPTQLTLLTSGFNFCNTRTKNVCHTHNTETIFELHQLKIPMYSDQYTL